MWLEAGSGYGYELDPEMIGNQIWMWLQERDPNMARIQIRIWLGVESGYIKDLDTAWIRSRMWLGAGYGYG